MVNENNCPGCHGCAGAVVARDARRGWSGDSPTWSVLDDEI